MNGTCPHCKEPIEVRNPSGYCDHLYYPDGCSVCLMRESSSKLNVGATIKAFPQHPQMQASLYDQIILLQRAANKLGLYDAEEWIAACMDVHKIRGG